MESSISTLNLIMAIFFVCLFVRGGGGGYTHVWSFLNDAKQIDPLHKRELSRFFISFAEADNRGIK